MGGEGDLISRGTMKSVELFAGGGGLAIGMAEAGFEHAAVLEWNSHACMTMRENQRRGMPLLKDWNVYEGDARNFDYSPYQNKITVVSGGPPCQPFSLGGKHGGQADSRDMFPEAVRTVRELQPKAFMFENVKGLLRDAFKNYFEYVCLQLTYPEIVRIIGEDLADHRKRLERHHTASNDKCPEGLKYNVVYGLLNAADYGVPQRRERVFIVGFRSNLGVEWAFPERTHSEETLHYDKYVTGEYWDRYGISRKARRDAPKKLKGHVVSIFPDHVGPILPAWRTVRDAIQDLPDPEVFPKNNIPNHSFNPGARVYPGHTGSLLDAPAKTLKAGGHGVPGGENMLARLDGSVRYFTVREAARLQTFPDRYVFSGSWTESMRQLGNAVPVKLAKAVAKSIAEALSERRSKKTLHAAGRAGKTV